MIKPYHTKFEGWKGRNFCGRPRATLSFATPLSTIFLTTTHLCRFHDLLPKTLA